MDATIIHAPSSTKNRSGERDPEMHQTRKGKQWYFGLKAHIGVDSKQGHVHSVCTSAASVADKHMLPDLLHGEERKVWGDGGYRTAIIGKWWKWFTEHGEAFTYVNDRKFDNWYF